MTLKSYEPSFDLPATNPVEDFHEYVNFFIEKQMLSILKLSVLDNRLSARLNLSSDTLPHQRRHR